MAFNKDNLRRARELRGYTKMDLAWRADVSQSQISEYESGRCQPKADKVRRLAKAFAVPHPDFLFLHPDGATLILCEADGGIHLLSLDQVTGVSYSRAKKLPHASAKP